MMCFVQSHKTHECLDVEDAAADHRKLLTIDRDEVSRLMRVTGEVLARCEQEKTDFISHLADVESEINTEADKLIAVIQRNRQKLLSEVESIKLKRVKQLRAVNSVLHRHTTALESFRRYSEMLLSSGTACDVA